MIKSIVDFVLKNKLAVWIITILLILGGMYSGTKMKMESLPDVSIPYMIVSTVYPGATPSKIDEDVSQKILGSIDGLEGVVSLNSTSYENMSLVTMEFDYGMDMDKVKINVEKELSKLNFEEAVMEPNVLQISMNSLPVLSMSISGEKLSKDKISDLVEKELMTGINELDGISEVQLSGTTYKEIQMNLKDSEMAKYNVTEETLLKLIEANNLDMSIGLVEFNESKESVFVKGSKENLDELKSMKLPFRSVTGQNLVLKDFVDLEFVEVTESVSRTNGEESISLSIVKGQEANTVEVVNNVKELVKTFESKNKNVTVIYTLDQGEPIEDSVHTMLSKALFGALVAVVIIMLFLRNIRSTIISIVSIPLSLLMSIILLNYLDITLNIMTLGAMTVAIGRVIDDSIVVVENIYRRLNLEDEKLKGRALIKAATLEMFLPILSSTMVTIAVFLPIALVGGMIGELFLPFALTMVFSLLASLLVSVTIVPVMAHSMFKKELRGDKEKVKEDVSRVSEVYQKALEWTLNHKLITILVSISLVVGSLALLPKVGFTFIPGEEEYTMSLSYYSENGETESDLESALEKAEKVLIAKEEIKSVQATLGSTGNIMDIGNSGGSITLQFNDELDKDKFTDYKKSLLKEVNKEKDSKGKWVEKSIGGAPGLSSNKLEYNVYGTTMEDVKDGVEKLQVVLKDKKDLEKVSSNLSSVYQENVLVIDEDKLSSFGLTTAQVGMSLYNFSSDKEITTIKEDGKDYKVLIKGKELSFNNFEEMLDKELLNINGLVVTVKDVVKVEEGTTIDSITREGSNLVATVSANLKIDDVRGISSEIDKEISKLDLLPGVNIETGGVSAQMTDAFTQLGLAMLAAIAIVYLLLVLTFREGLAPFVILFSLPMTVVGVIISLLVSGETLNISSMLGLLMLIGIVVTNAIVLVDRILQNEYSGKEMREAIVEAGKTRVRPILMTAFATIGALIPLAIGAEGGGLISKGLGITVIGGILSSTILTLFIVPVIYELLSKLFRKDRKNIDND